MPTYSNEWDRGDARANNEHRNRMGFGGTEHGSIQEAERSRVLGGQAQGRATYQSDFGQGNQARGVAGQGVDLALSAARGQQPSAAEILAQRNNTAAIRAGQSMAAGVKGGAGARVAAMRNAQRMGAQQMADGAQRSEQLRAQEMADARGQVIQGGLGMRAGDHDAQRIQQTNELTQRGLNDTQQRFFEQQRFNTQVQDQNNQLAQQGMANGAWSAGRGAEQSDEQFGFGKMMKWTEAGAGAASGAVSGIATSDEAAKNLIPAGSLAPLFGGGRGAANPHVTAGADASFDKLSPGGGMDVTGSLKAHSNFATKFQRDPSGGMMSDVTTKNPRDIMYSPGEIKDPVAFVDATRRAGGYARPDMTPIPAPSVQPRAETPSALSAGIAASAEGASPYAIDRPDPDAEAKASFARSFNTDAAVADAHKADNRKEGQKIREGFEKDAGGPKHTVMGSLAGMLGGLSGGARMRSDVKSKDGVMYSDDKTKLAAAYEAGKSAAGKAVGGKPEIGGKVKDAVKGATGEDAKKLRDVAIQAGGHLSMSPASATNALVDQAGDQLKATTEAKPAEARAAMPGVTAMEYAAPIAFGPIGGALATRYAKSDEKAKNVIDLDEPEIDLDKPEPGSDKSTMRDGPSDPRAYSAEKNMVTGKQGREQMKRELRASQDKAGKDADAMMAGMRASMGKGPSARSEDLQDDAPDLRSAAKAGGDAGNIPEHAMFRAMKAMEPSLYSYKPEFKPPEQAPGEVQAGPMANNMERDPIAGTAIVKDPGTGLLAIDKDKALKLTMGSLAVLAQDVEQMKRKKGAR